MTAIKEKLARDPKAVPRAMTAGRIDLRLELEWFFENVPGGFQGGGEFGFFVIRVLF